MPHIAIEKESAKKTNNTDDALIIHWTDSGGVVNRDIVSESVEFIQIGGATIATSSFY